MTEPQTGNQKTWGQAGGLRKEPPPIRGKMRTQPVLCTSQALLHLPTDQHACYVLALNATPGPLQGLNEHLTNKRMLRRNEKGQRTPQQAAIPGKAERRPVSGLALSLLFRGRARPCSRSKDSSREGRCGSPASLRSSERPASPVCLEATARASYLLLQCPFQSVHSQLLLPQAGLVGSLLLLGLAPDLGDLGVGPAGMGVRGGFGNYHPPLRMPPVFSLPAGGTIRLQLPPQHRGPREPLFRTLTVIMPRCFEWVPWK